METSNIFRNALLGLVGVGAVAGLVLLGQIVETNDAGYYQIKQAAMSGNMSIRSEPGTYYQGFAKLTTYPFVDDINLDGTEVRFRDGSTAKVFGTVKFSLPASEKERLRLHTELQAYQNVKQITIKDAVDGTLKQSANLFGAEEVYSTRRAEFVQMFNEQLTNGLYKTSEGVNVNNVVRDKDGRPVVIKPSVLTEYGIRVINVEITDVDFDEKTDALIAARKESEQAATVARAQAEQAKQDALTTEERGKAAVATAKYQALVVKEQAVVEAEKQTAMQKESTLQAIEIAKQTEAKGKAEAFRQAALVQAGLSPREKAEIERDTAIGVARELAKVRLPSTFVAGSNGKDGGSLDPFTAVGLNQFYDLSKKMANDTQ